MRRSFTVTLTLGALAVLAAGGIAGCKSRGYNERSESSEKGFDIRKLFGLGSPNFVKSLNAVLSLRCQTLLGGEGGDTNARLSCQSSVNPFLSALDFHGKNETLDVPGKGPTEVLLTVSFQREIESMATDPAATAWVKALQEELRAVELIDDYELDLWKFSLKHFAGDKDQALRHVAVLLQDLHAKSQVVHLYAQARERPELKDFAVQLGAAVDDYVRFLKAKKVTKPGNKLVNYPLPGAAPKESFYHFYVMAHLARMLDRNARGDKGNVRLPTIFNAEYEFQQIGRAQDKALEEQWKKETWVHAKVDGLLKAVVKVKREFVRPLAPFERAPHESSIMDVYNGYAGAMWGVGREAAIEPYETFADGLAKDPMGKMRSLLLGM